MAAPGARMRLTVEVLPLEAENAHGPYRAQAIAAFKGRKFALPVQLEDTFERVWSLIEQRYKTNYLDAQQAAAFTIKKLQDAYDCDLDLGDTVSSIFEGETDPSMRTIKVVPSFVNRDFSVPATSNLRPGYAQKRLREINAEHANKRRRVEQLQLEDVSEEVDPARDQPIPTTESERSADDSVGEGGLHGAQLQSRSRRSQTGGSWVVVNDAQTGHAEFGPGVKEESPELGPPPTREALGTTPLDDAFKKPPVPVSRKSPRKRQLIRSRSKTHESPQAISKRQVDEEVPELNNATVQDVSMHEEEVIQAKHNVAASPRINSQDAALNRSPRPTSEPSQDTTPPAAAKRKDVYEVSSSPEFLSTKSKSKSKKTYSKSPRTATTIQKEVDLLNHSRRLSTRVQPSSYTQRSILDSLSKKARTFQLPKPDVIESTPQEEEEAAAAASLLQRGARAESIQNNEDLTAAFLDSATRALQAGIQTPDRTVSAKTGRPGSLKKPSKNILPATPSSASRGVQFHDAQSSAQSTRARADSDAKSSVASPASSTNLRGKKLDPEIQARVDKLRRQRRGSPRVIAKQPPRQNPMQSNTDSGSSGNSPAAQIAAEIAARSSTQPENASVRDATSVEHATNTSNDSARLSVQPPPRSTPVKSPVPLPENVRRLTANGTDASVKANSSDGGEVFKKPDLKLWSMKSNRRANSASTERRGSGSTDRKSTPLRNEVPLSGTGDTSVKPAAGGSVRRLSSSSDASETANRSQILPPSNQGHFSRGSSTQESPHVNGDSSTTGVVSPATALVTPKRRGRPPKNAGIDSQQTPKPTPKAEAATRNEAVETPPRPRRGRPLKSAGNASKESPVPTPVVDFVPPPSPGRNPDANEAIVISSREPSTSDYTDSEEEEQQHTVSQVVDEAVAQPLQTQKNGTAQLHKTIPTGNDAELLPDADADANMPISSQRATAIEEDKAQDRGEDVLADAGLTLYQSSNPTDGNNDLRNKDEPTPTATSWGTESWGFGRLDQSNDAPGTLVGNDVPQDHGFLQVQANTEGTTEDEVEAESASGADTKSGSASAANSTRSSPAITRRPARFLSHSPTPEAEDSEDESEDTSAAASKTATPPPPDEDEESESDSSSDSDESEAEDEDTEMPDAAVPDSTTGKTETAIPSSPPRLPILSNSTPVVPETSQPAPSQIIPSAIRRTPVPLPPLSQPRSSQSVSAQAAARRPAARYAGFRTLREQLADAKSKPTTPQAKPYDPRTLNLGKLAAKAKGGSNGAVGVGNDDDTSEEESSSSSSDSD
ncbi:Nn.00g101240.m01.CDS01 [Neocucurbitaria sp. VM-36]